MKVLRSMWRTRQAAKLSLAALVLIGFSCATFLRVAAQEQIYTLDPARSRILVQVGKTGAFGFMAHNHEVEASRVSGRVAFNATDPARSSVSLEIDTASLRVTGKGEPAGDVAEVQQTMAGPKVLDVAQFPRIAFASREVAATGHSSDGLTLRSAGNRTLHGVTKPHTVTVTASMTGDEIVARGTTTVKQTEYGMKPVTAGGGTVRVKDELAVSFTVYARR
jgi:polyisoprenoid-binding protein YceI